MPSSTRYASAFKRHLSYFDRDGNGIVTFGESLRASLALGLDFPVALISSIGLPLLYGNAGLLYSNINVQHVKTERTMLEDVKLRQASYSRADLLQLASGSGWIDWFHVLSLWGLAADNSGRVSSDDVSLFQRGQLLPELERRRRDRSNVLPLLRGGPIS